MLTMNVKLLDRFRDDMTLYQLSPLSDLDCMNLVAELTTFLRNVQGITLSFDGVTAIAMKMNNCLRPL